MKFVKYQGTGNDFVMIDNREQIFPDWTTVNSEGIRLIKRLCDRRLGIGGDGLILIQNVSNYDFECVYFNADGSQSLCGNGSRCAVMFARDLGIIKNKTVFLAIDGSHEAFIKGDQVHLKMGDVKEVLNCSSFAAHKFPKHDMFVNTGSPHHIQWKDNVSKINVVGEGATIRNCNTYKPAGTNVNFVEILGTDALKVRTYERGVEDETLSCGTGVTAVAIAASNYHKMQSPIVLQVQGGTLRVSFKKITDQHFKDIYLIGPAENVFQGSIEIA